MKKHKVPHLSRVTEPGFGGEPSDLLVTDRIEIGSDAHPSDLEVYVVAGEYVNGLLDTDEASIVIAADGRADDSKWGVLDIDDPAVAWRLVEVLTAAGHVLDRIKVGELP